MKAKLLPCAVSVFLSLTAGAQEIVKIRTADAPAGGSAEIYGGYETGGFRPGFAASSLWKAGAKAKGTRHGDRTSWTGSFGFEQVEGKDMFTSMFLYPGYYPIDVLEFTPGDKTRQTYSLGGGLVTEPGEDWLLGGKVAYQAANYAKRKDIRHTSYGTDLRAEPTLALRLGNRNDVLSLSYIFCKKAETIDAEQVGSATDASYYAFLDKGLRYGSYQVWDGDGIHLDEAGVGLLPIREYSHGFAYLIDTRPFTGRMELLWKHGTVGDKGYTWFRYPGFVFLDDLGGSHRAGRATGRWGLRFRIETDQLEESVLEKVTEGGITTPVVHAFNKVSHRIHGNMDLSYGLFFREGFFRRLKATLSGTAWTEESYLLYPYDNRLDLVMGSALLQAGMTAGRLDLALDLRFGAGGMQEKGLGEVREDAPVQPFRLQGDWDRKMEYMTATRCGAGLRATWRFRAVPGLSLTAEGDWLHGFNLTFLPGNDRFSTALRLGYGF